MSIKHSLFSACLAALLLAGCGSSNNTSDNSTDNPQLSISNASQLEGDSGFSSISILVSLDKTADTAVTFDYAVSDGTALAGSDFTAQQGSGQIAAQSTSTIIEVALIGDLDDEGDEVFNITLSNVQNADLAQATAQITILDDDILPTVTIDNVDILETDVGSVQLVVSMTLDSSVNTSTEVEYTTSDGTAVAGIDYIASSGIAVFPASQTLTMVQIPVNGDTEVELDEIFTINFSAASASASATVINPVVLATIRDDDSASAPALTTRPSNSSCRIANPPSAGGGVKLTQVFSSLNFDLPVVLLQAPGNNDRWYVVEQDGLIKTFLTGDNTSTIFADLTDRVVHGGGQDERGLLGMAFHPDYQNNKQVFLHYNSNNGGLTSITARYVTPDNGLTLTVPAFASEDIILQLSQPSSNHNGGDIAFGPDGFLYIGFGDGGGSNDIHQNGLDTTTLLGSMLRIDVDNTTPSLGLNYAIPSDNPFVSNGNVLNEIFAYGLRNPWRWSFDRTTGDLYAGDVGQGAREEINLIQSGQHYGWGCYEGSLFNNNYPGDCTGITNNPPLHEYNRSSGTTVSGGYVYRGSNPSLTFLQGTYLYADFGFGTIWGLDPSNASASNEVLINTSMNISAFGEDNSGELYVLSWSDGNIFRIDPVANSQFPQLLSESGCVDPANPQLVDASMIPYRINARFWSDGALKDRWFALPDGETITIDAQHDWDFPIGSVLMKSFRLDGDLVETRLLARHDDGDWGGYSYEWNGAGTDANLVLNGKTKAIAGQSYIFPSSAQCSACHTVAAGHTLGPETAQLNTKQSYPNNANAIGNQITALDNIGLFSSSPGAPGSLPRLVDPHNSLQSDDDRVRAYLHTNCSQCHQPNNFIQNVDIDFRYTTPWSSMNICNVAPTRGDLNVSGAQRLLPGDAGSSIIFLRMSQRGANAMPPLGSTLVDDSGADLLREWINGLQQCPG